MILCDCYHWDPHDRFGCRFPECSCKYTEQERIEMARMLREDSAKNVEKG